ncbi:nucleoside triphosphate pyrophosphohydrolase [Halolamina litorea]|uniref:Phosphoribosyl-ATP pyrophosphohydrolase n=1 Tax=Halolamina litorea TaxID=1515593 RepID=A0ABD6BST4_9EURY
MSREYDKLVRDEIPAIIAADGETPITHAVEGETYEARLFEKLAEETAELRGSPGVEEFADVLEVLDALRQRLGVEEAELERVRAEKAVERGRFDDGVVLERVEGGTDGRA